MKPTAEKIRYERYNSKTVGASDFAIYTDPDRAIPEKPIASTQGGSPEDEANAALIVAAWNACADINPNNPIAAADAILSAFEAIKKIANWEFDIRGDCVAEARTLARRVFLNATDREA